MRFLHQNTVYYATLLHKTSLGTLFLALPLYTLISTRHTDGVTDPVAYLEERGHCGMSLAPFPLLTLPHRKKKNKRC